MKRCFFTSLAASCLLSSCVLDTHTRIADYGREFECVLPEGKRWNVFRTNVWGTQIDSVYIEGRTVYCTRRSAWTLDPFAPSRDAAYTLIPEEEHQPLLTYRLETMEPAELPEYAVLSGVDCRPDSIPTGKSRCTLHAVWAYPLSAVSLVMLDVPSVLVYGLYFTLATPFIEMGMNPFPDLCTQDQNTSEMTSPFKLVPLPLQK